MSTVIRDVEIFRTGVHAGDSYTEADLDGMVRAAQELDYRPALKIGHTKDEPGAPSYGWIENVKRVGQKLVADFTSMHSSVIEAIRKRAYDRVSSEVFFNLKRGGKTFPRALKAVALLGAEVPAVPNLVPLHQMEFEGVTFERLGTASEQPLTSGYDVSMLVHNRVVQYRKQHPEIKTYEVALKAVLTGDAELRRTYVQGVEPVATAWAGPDLEQRQEAGWRIHEKMLVEIEAHPTWSQMQALQAVLTKNPDLAEAYRGGHGSFVPSFDAIMGSGGPGR